MKKIVLVILPLLLIASLAFAQGQNNNQRQQTQLEQGSQDQGEEPILIMDQDMTEEINRVKQRVQEKKQEMNQEMEGLKRSVQKVYQNQNQVREAAHSLLEMEDIVGGIGQRVSEIAREFNNSVQATIGAEEKIQGKNRILKFFVGGDSKSAEAIEQEVNRNRERIQQLNQLMEQCDCEQEVKTMLQEQIQNMEQEQNRLEEVAVNETKIKGVWGWLKGLFGR